MPIPNDGRKIAINNLDQLAGLVDLERKEILSQWRRQVRLLPSAQQLDTPTLIDHIPGLLNELIAALRSHSDVSIPESLVDGSPPAHGLQRVLDGFDIEEVVAEYNILRDCIHDLANERGLNLQGPPFHILNRVLDQAIGLAVQSYAAQQALNVQNRRQEYLAFVAHDLRTPLNAISLATSLLELSIPDPGSASETDKMLKLLRRNVRHLEKLVSKVLDENTNPQTDSGVTVVRREIELWPLVQALIQELHPLASASSTRLVNCVPQEFALWADASLMKRIFQNLIANAVKYAPRGEVTIAARALNDHSGAECWVSDNGAGISAEKLPKVFDKYVTDAQNSSGRGLGLAIVKSFVEAHGGQVSVESQPGKGSTFRLAILSMTPTSASSDARH